MRLHAVVADVRSGRAAAAAGATVVQLRLKSATSDERVAAAHGLRGVAATIVINDDVEAALAAGCGVHLGQGDPGWEQARDSGILLGLSAAGVTDAVRAAAYRPRYIGAGPVWASPTKPDAAPPVGLDGLREICAAVDVPVIAIGSVDAGNAAACIEAGAAGVAVVRAASDSAGLREVIDAALLASISSSRRD